MTCFCTGACRTTGQCPNGTAVPWQPRPPYPGVPFPQRPSVSRAPLPQGDVHIHNGISEERVREIIREELQKFLEEWEREQRRAARG